MKLTLYYLILVSALVGCNNVSTSEKETDKAKENINVSKKTAEDPIKTKSTQSNQDDWYWKNTFMSTNNKFDEWKEGEVKLVMIYRKQQNNTQPGNVEVGTINSEGVVTLNLPSEIKTETKLNNLSNLVLYDIQDITNLDYENSNSGYFSNTTISVEKNGTIIGNLTIGNSVRTTYNLTNQSTLTMGDEGYILYLAYLDDASRLNGTEIRTDKVRRDGTNTIEAETIVIYDLDFKSGWNFVKVEVIGSYDLKHERGLNASWFKKHNHIVVPEMPNDAAYFFRKLGN